MRKFTHRQFIAHRAFRAARGTNEILDLSDSAIENERRALFGMMAESVTPDGRTVIDWRRTIRRDEENRRTEIVGEATVYRLVAPPDAAATAPDTFPVSLAIDAINDGQPELAVKLIEQYLQKHEEWRETSAKEAEWRQREEMGVPERMYGYPMHIDDEFRLLLTQTNRSLGRSFSLAPDRGD